MESAFRTPLLDAFRRGDVARDIRLSAARGEMAPRDHEQLGLLMFLAGDADAEIAATADATLSALPQDTLAAFLSRSDVSTEMRMFFAQRGVEAAPVETGADTTAIDVAADPEPAAEERDAEQSAVQRLAAMTIAQRLERALKGTREERAVLIRDPNKIVAAAVLSSPKLSETEVENIARMASVAEDVLRIIASTRAWVKKYPIVLALAKNPKTPVALSMNLLSRLNDKDLRQLATDRNIPDVLRLTARKKVSS